MDEFDENVMQVETNNIISEELRQRDLEERRKRGKIQIGQDEYYKISKTILYYF